MDSVVSGNNRLLPLERHRSGLRLGGGILDASCNTSRNHDEYVDKRFSKVIGPFGGLHAALSKGGSNSVPRPLGKASPHHRS
jgi:hypothetical protein